MTESSGPDAHLGLDRLADLEEGLLTPAEEQAARDHLAGCAVCQEDAAALATVHAMLLDDAEVPMPADIAGRLYAALGEQPALTPPVAAVTTLPARSGPSAWERRRKPVLITLAAAAAVTLLTLGVIHLPRSSGSTSTAASESSAAAPAAGPQILHSGHNYTAAGLGTDGAALVGGGTATSGAAAATAGAAAATSAAAAAPTSAAAAATSAAAAGGFTSAAAATSAGTSEAATSAAASAAGVPANAGASSAAGATAVPTPAATTDALGPLRAPDAAQRCIALLLQSSVPPLVIDFATFNGKPAVIGVVPDPQDPAKLAVIAVGPPACSLYSLNYVPKP